MPRANNTRNIWHICITGTFCHSYYALSKTKCVLQTHYF